MKRVFNTICVARSSFHNVGKNERELYLAWKKTKKIRENIYDRIFLTQERIFDTLLVSAINKNGNSKCSYIEEDCYFSLKPEMNRPGYRPTRRNTTLYIFGRCVRKIGQTIMYGKNFYEAIGIICI